MYFVILYTQYGSYFIFHYWSLASKNPASIFFRYWSLLINYLTYLHVAAGRMAAIVEFCPTHRRSRPEIQKWYSNAALFFKFFRRWRTICTALQPMGSNGRYLKKCPKPCWPIKSKETWTKHYNATNIIKPTQTRITSEKYTFWVIKSLEHLKNLITGRVPYLDLELTMHVLKSQTLLVRQSL